MEYKNTRKKLAEKIFISNFHILVLIFLLGFLSYMISINGPFIWDDLVLILKNEQIRSFSNYKEWFTTNAISGAGEAAKSNLYRPISTLVNAALYHIFEFNVIGYHIVNIIIHSINAFLVFLLARRLNFMRITGLIAAVIFVVHPVHSEIVAHIAGLPDLLSALFVLIGLLLFTNNAKGLLHYIGLILFFALALLSKESGIVFLPLAILLAIYNWRNYKTDIKKQKKIALTLLAVSTVIYLYLKFTIFNFSDAFGLQAMQNTYTDNLHIRIFTFISVLWDYAVLTFFPKNLYFTKEFEIYKTLATLKGLFGSAIIIGGLIGSYFSFKKSRKFLLGFFWFFLAIAPVSGIVPVNSTYTEHWLYLPIIGIILFTASIFETLKTKKSKKIFLTIFAIIGIVLALRTVERNFEWTNTFNFYENELKYNQTDPRLYNQIGLLHFKEKKFEKAIEYFKQGIEADEFNLYSDLHYNMGSSYYNLKNYNAAIKQYLLVFETNPNYLASHNMLYQLFTMAGQNERASKFQEFAKRIKAGGTVEFDEILELSNLNK